MVGWLQGKVTKQKCRWVKHRTQTANIPPTTAESQIEVQVGLRVKPDTSNHTSAIGNSFYKHTHLIQNEHVGATVKHHR